VSKINNFDLSTAFKEFNKRYFGKSLDSNIEVSFKRMNVLGRTKTVWFQRPVTAKERKENGLNKTAIACYYIPRIWISEEIRFSPRLCIQTLLHEMVHAEDMTRGCGPNWNRFNKRMLKLAKQGAFNGWW
jgi:hypothetical protein